MSILFFSVELFIVGRAARRSDQMLISSWCCKSLVLLVQTSIFSRVISVMFAFKCFYFPSGFYIVDFIQTYCFHSSLDSIISIYSLGAARGTLRLHSRDLLFLLLLLFTCLFNSGDFICFFLSFFFESEMTYLALICEQKIFRAQIWTVCSRLRY